MRNRILGTKGRKNNCYFESDGTDDVKFSRFIYVGAYLKEKLYFGSDES